MTASLPGGGELVLDPHQRTSVRRPTSFGTRSGRAAISTTRAASARRSRARKSPRVRAFLQWRDPDWNRRHHDFSRMLLLLSLVGLQGFRLVPACLAASALSRTLRSFAV